MNYELQHHRKITPEQSEAEADQRIREAFQRTHGITDEQYQELLAAEKALKTAREEADLDDARTNDEVIAAVRARTRALLDGERVDQDITPPNDRVGV